jgi:hypothetical protein
VKYWGPIEKSASKKKFSWYTADAQPSTLVQLHKIYQLRVQYTDFDQVGFQFSLKANLQPFTH